MRRTRNSGFSSVNQIALYQKVKEPPHTYPQRFDDGGGGLMKVYIYMILS